MKQRHLTYEDLPPGAIWWYPRGRTEHVVLPNNKSRTNDHFGRDGKHVYSVPPKQPVIRSRRRDETTYRRWLDYPKTYSHKMYRDPRKFQVCI